jgi:hypothetical protein
MAERQPTRAGHGAAGNFELAACFSLSRRKSKKDERAPGIIIPAPSHLCVVLLMGAQRPGLPPLLANVLRAVRVPRM